MDEATFVILFLNVITFLFYLTVEGVINYLIIIITRFFYQNDTDKWGIQYHKCIKNLEEFIIYRVITAIILTIMILVIYTIMGRYLYSNKSLVNCYFRNDYLQMIIAAMIIAISSAILAIINNTYCSRRIKLIFFVSSSIFFQLNFLLYNIKAVLTF
jgi:hypothetical protein